MLRSLSGLRRWRRGTLRFKEEHSRIALWLEQIATMARKNYAVAVELAALQHMVRGYGDTFERGLKSFERLSKTATDLADRPDGAAELKRLHALEVGNA
jgi:indolepyruvate ferredoxin oxidoreductase beta subunit